MTKFIIGGTYIVPSSAVCVLFAVASETEGVQLFPFHHHWRSDAHRQKRKVDGGPFTRARPSHLRTSSGIKVIAHIGDMWFLLYYRQTAELLRAVMQ